jgi:hypothetical protein
MTAFDRLLRANLDAGITFPALLRFLIKRLHRVTRFRTVLVQFHQVVGADIHASGLVLTLAAVTLISTHKCWHGFCFNPGCIEFREPLIYSPTAHQLVKSNGYAG